MIKNQNVDLLICNMITYATSSVFASVLLNCDILPMILTALQPRSNLDYTKANTFMQLENDSICAGPEFMGVANRLGKKIYDIIIGILYNGAAAEGEFEKWHNIAKILHDLKGARVGLMGHTMEAMYDMNSDPPSITAAFVIHVPLLEIDDTVEVYNAVTEEEVQAKSAAALDRLVEKYKLTGLAYYHEGTENTIHGTLATTFIVVYSILNA